MKVSHPTALAAHQEAVSAAERQLQEAEDKLDALISAKAQESPDVRDLRTTWPTLELDEKREILRAGVDAVLVRRASGPCPEARRSGTVTARLYTVGKGKLFHCSL